MTLKATASSLFAKLRSQPEALVENHTSGGFNFNPTLSVKSSSGLSVEERKLLERFVALSGCRNVDQFVGWLTGETASATLEQARRSLESHAAVARSFAQRQQDNALFDIVEPAVPTPSPLTVPAPSSEPVGPHRVALSPLPLSTTGRGVTPMDRTPLDDMVRGESLSAHRILRASPADIEARKQQMLAEREKRIRAIASGNTHGLTPRPPLMAKDGTAQVKSLAYVHASAINRQVSDLSRWVKSLGLSFDVIARNSNDYVNALGLTDFVSRVHDELKLPEWLEDYLLCRTDGSFSLPPPRRPQEAPGAIAQDLLSELRREFGHELAGSLIEVQSSQGEAIKHVHSAIEFLLSLPGRPCTFDNAYLEGGNTLSGLTPQGEPYALVGMDSFRVAARRLREEFPDLPMDDALVRKLIADDMGVEVKHLHLVEQPGAFHLDMGIAVLPNQTALVNDSRAFSQFAAQQGASHSPEVAEKLKLAAEREDLAAQQLEALGFKVVRGPFAAHRVLQEDPLFPTSMRVNWLNNETGLAPNGQRFMVCNGELPGLLPSFGKALQAAGAGDSLQLFFTSSDDASYSLQHGGGFGCRMKALPFGLHQGPLG